MTHCNALATLVRLAVLVLSVTRRATMFTPGATPRSLGSSEPINPAMAVPCCDDVAMGLAVLSAKSKPAMTLSPGPNPPPKAGLL